MSDGAAEHISHDVDLVFGDGSNPRSKSVTHYLWSSVAGFRTVAHQFSGDAGLYGKAWILVLLAAISGAASELMSDFAATSLGLLAQEEFDESIFWNATSVVSVVVMYPLLRIIWPYILRQGSGFSDRSICAASALSIGVTVFLTPLYVVTVWLLTASGILGWMGEDTPYSQSQMFLIVPYLLVSLAIMSFYFSDTLDIGKVRAFVFSFLSTLIWIVAVLVPVTFLYLSQSGGLGDIANFPELPREAPYREE